MVTTLTTGYPIEKEILFDVIVNNISKWVLSEMEILKQDVAMHYNRGFDVGLTKGRMYDRKNHIVYPNLTTYKCMDIISIDSFNMETFRKKKFIEAYENELPSVTWLKSIRSYLKQEFRNNTNTYILCKVNDKQYKEGYALYNFYHDVIKADAGMFEHIVVFPVVNLNEKDDSLLSFIENICQKHSLYPPLTKNSSRVLEMYSCMKKYISVKDNAFYCDAKEVMEDYMKGMTENIYQPIMDVLRRVLEEKKISEEESIMDIETLGLGDSENIKDYLLNCEKIRADIEPYEEKILTDPNRGHWDLWCENSDDTYTIELAEELMARNPKADINEEGVIAIDFGTKSTIVVYQSDIEHSLPMGIGDGNISKDPTPKRYENPTIMQFVNLERFMSAYDSKAGRPNTLWEDLPISHTAMDKFQNSKSEEYYAFLHQIKQWAGQREKQFRIQPIEGDSLILSSFLDLKDDDFNPIELYAYYIGLYINNMRKGHGIFLDYYLSFPVTYEKEIRQKIVDSFTKGLKKSLPVSIQQDEEVMKKFKVNGDISEPAAYAVCALQEYGFDPEDDEEIFYGIFDFGGGTTDFDFGLWKRSSKRRYDYCIENFGAGGDQYLGGENLLEMLAFEIFKENQDVMRKDGFTFALAPKATEFLGSDALLSDSQEAEKNMHNLMEVLRPYWEKDELSNVSWEDFERLELEELLKKIKNATENRQDSMKIATKIHSIQNTLIDDHGKCMEAIGNLIDEFGLVFASEDDTELTLKVTLFDKNGKDHPNVSLTTSVSYIDNFIEEKIREGVNNFFTALMLSYDNDKVKKPTKVNILLAGNSCKSPVVKKVFMEEIAKREQQICEMYKLDSSNTFFEIFPPLGTSAAYKKMDERGIPYSENDFEKPTGKTGVAFGLIQCRKGGTIERISNVDSNAEIPFQYYLGWQSRKKFVVFRDDSKLTTFRGKPDYNEWYKFIEADDDTFYIYYTTLPECVNGDLRVDGNAAVKRLKCTIDCVDDNAFVYIRAVDPHTIEYVVANSYDIDNSKLGEIYRREID